MLCCYQKAAASAARAFDPLILRQYQESIVPVLCSWFSGLPMGGLAEGWRRHPFRKRASIRLVRSIRTPSATIEVWCSLVNTPRWGRGNRSFESSHLDQIPGCSLFLVLCPLFFTRKG